MMKARCRPSRLWIRRALWGAGSLTGLVLLAFVVVQILLATAWLRGKAEAKISARIGLPASIEELAWMPWTGAEIRGLRIDQPEPLKARFKQPLATVESIRIWPDYAKLLRGNLGIVGAEIEAPQLTLSIEMLASIAASHAPPVSVPPVASAVVQPASPGPLPPSLPVGGDGPTNAPRGGEPSAVQAPKQKATVTPEDPPIKATDSHDEAATWFSVHGASFELVSLSSKLPLVKLSDLDFDLPLFGPETGAAFTLGSLACLEQTIVSNIQGQLKSQGREVILVIPENPEKASEVSGQLKVRLVAGLPFEAALAAKAGEPMEFPLAKEDGVRMEGMKLGLRGMGWLQAPGSWTGLCQIGAQDLTVRFRRSPIQFQRLGGVMSLSGGSLRLPDLRIVGDEFSLLGNGWLSASDGFGILRVVMPGSSAEDALRSNGLGDLNEYLKWTPIDPGNRSYIDLDVWRDSRGWMLGIGEKGVALPIKQFLTR